MGRHPLTSGLPFQVKVWDRLSPLNVSQSSAE